MGHIQPMLNALTGLAIGDALGRQAFMNRQMILDHCIPQTPWMYTDDTRMALAIARTLKKYGKIDQQVLADHFGRDFQDEPDRGYGAVAHYILHQLAQGVHWSEAATSVYGGDGSKGNGAAMRVAPLGAFFSHDIALVLEEAKKSAQVTHAHPEGILGAQAIALMASRLEHDARLPAPEQLLLEISTALPDAPLTRAIAQAASLAPSTTPQQAGQCLGTGVAILALDTVPLCLWLAAHYHHDFEAAMLATFASFESIDSDADTIAAIVGGLVAIRCVDSIPAPWRDSTEPWCL